MFKFIKYARIYSPQPSCCYIIYFIYYLTDMLVNELVFLQFTNCETLKLAQDCDWLYFTGTGS